MHGEHWRQKNNLFWVDETRELCFNFSPRRRRLWFTNPPMSSGIFLVGDWLVFLVFMSKSAPLTCVSIPGWFKASAGITIRAWVSNILRLLVSVRTGIQQLNFCQYYCFIMVLKMYGGGASRGTSQTILVPAYVRKHWTPEEKLKWWQNLLMYNLESGFTMECQIYVG